MIKYTAPEECLLIRKKFKTNPVPSTRLGNKMAVLNAHRLGLFPRSVLYNRPEWYPAMRPMKQ